MMRYRKKPVVIEAFRYGRDDEPDWWHHAEIANRIKPSPPHSVYIHTPEGTMRADLGDWIIKGIKGEIYPCKPDIFAETYEPCEP